MANSPEADIELLFFTSSADETIKSITLIDTEKKTRPRMRIRLSRRLHSIEISKALSGPQGKEWLNKTIKTSSCETPLVSSHDMEKLEPFEIEGISQVERFLHVCSAYESCQGASPTQHPHLEYRWPSAIPKLKAAATSTPISSTVFPSVSIQPRPRLFSGSATSTCHTDAVHETSLQDGLPSQRHLSLEVCRSDSPADASALSMSNFDMLQTRFLPSVGWCIRYGSQVSQGGRYKVMFLDGPTLEVDVDEEWVEYRDNGGKPIRYDHACSFA